MKFKHPWMQFFQPVAVAGLLTLMAACNSASETPSPSVNAPAAEASAEDTQAEAVDHRTEIEALLETAKSTRGKGTPAIWTLADNDTTVYLFGSFHLLKPGFEWRSDKIDTAFEQADRVFFEADVISPEAQAAAGPLMIQAGLFSDGTKLTDLLNDEEDARLAKAAAAAGLPLPALEGLKPWMASVFLSQSIILQAGFDPAAGVEATFDQQARASGKTLGYLETLEAQLAALSAGTEEEQIEGLMVSIATLEFGPEMINALADEWADGDTAGLTAMVASPSALGSETVYEALLVNRNRSWVPQIIDMLETPGTNFVAVGAAHLVGTDSVIAMLRADGYEVNGP